MFIDRNAEGVHGQRKFGNPWSNWLLGVNKLVGICNDWPL